MSTEKHKTYHLMILDRSSSMSMVRDVTISGLNEQLESIRQTAKDHDDQEQFMCFVTFANDVELDQIWNQPIGEVDDFNYDTYAPLGMTALLEAIGSGITKLKSEIKDELAERKANVIVTIFTDGEENHSSREWKGPAVKTLVDEVEETGLWTVVFIGCGNEEDVFAAAQTMGISRGNTMSYDAGTVGTQSAFTGMAKSRSLRASSYSDAISKGLDTEAINQAGNFFDNMDVEPDSDMIMGGDVTTQEDLDNLDEMDGPNSAI